MAKNIGLAAIVAAMATDPHFTWVPKAEANELVGLGLVEVNAELADPSKKGRLATRATQKGVEKNTADLAAATANGSTDAAGNSTGEVAKPKFEIQKGVTIPAVSGRGGGRPGGSLYPFADLEVGDSFFVAKPSKNLASTVSSANARYSEDVLNEDGSPKMRLNRKNQSVPATKQTRTFIVRSVKEGDVSGSRIWRKL